MPGRDCTVISYRKKGPGQGSKEGKANDHVNVGGTGGLLALTLALNSHVSCSHLLPGWLPALLSCTAVLPARDKSSVRSYRFCFPYMVINPQLIVAFKMTLNPGELGRVKT